MNRRTIIVSIVVAAGIISSGLLAIVGHFEIAVFALLSLQILVSSALLLRALRNQARSHARIVQLASYVEYQRQRASTKEFHILKNIEMVDQKLDDVLANQRRIPVLENTVDAAADEIAALTKIHESIAIGTKTLLDISLTSFFSTENQTEMHKQ